MTENPLDSDSSFAALSSLLPPKAELSELDLFERWLDTSQPGREYIYATGVTWLHERKKNRPNEHLLDADIRAVAKAAWKAYERGEVELAQRRNEQGSLDYICQKRKER